MERDDRRGIKMNEYTIRDLEKDLERLDKKANALEALKMEFDDLANIVAPVYMAKRMELMTKYFDVKISVKNVKSK